MNFPHPKWDPNQQPHREPTRRELWDYLFQEYGDPYPEEYAEEDRRQAEKIITPHFPSTPTAHPPTPKTNPPPDLQRTFLTARAHTSPSIENTPSVFSNTPLQRVEERRNQFLNTLATPASNTPLNQESVYPTQSLLPLPPLPSLPAPPHRRSSSPTLGDQPLPSQPGEGGLSRQIDRDSSLSSPGSRSATPLSPRTPTQGLRPGQPRPTLTGTLHYEKKYHIDPDPVSLPSPRKHPSALKSTTSPTVQNNPGTFGSPPTITDQNRYSIASPPEKATPSTSTPLEGFLQHGNPIQIRQFLQALATLHSGLQKHLHLGEQSTGPKSTFPPKPLLFKDEEELSLKLWDHFVHGQGQPVVLDMEQLELSQNINIHKQFTRQAKELLLTYPIGVPSYKARLEHLLKKKIKAHYLSPDGTQHIMVLKEGYDKIVPQLDPTKDPLRNPARDLPLFLAFGRMKVNLTNMVITIDHAKKRFSIMSHLTPFDPDKTLDLYNFDNDSSRGEHWNHLVNLVHQDAPAGSTSYKIYGVGEGTFIRTYSFNAFLTSESKD